MNTKRIQELIQLMTDYGLNEMELEQEGLKVKFIKRPYGVVEQTMIPGPVVSHREFQTAPAASQGKADKAPSNLAEIKAPMVGTFYRAPSPEADPYVRVGDVIHKGDVICIIEAMKLMNEVKSEVDGKIVNILSENAEPVEFGQALFQIEPL
ncbi:MAG: acetyl-CoA carboxylase biotin carboxyl carrier protein [Candidatus Omnitrophica bacterium]|nr:acetyl-CoA carboxylase biotin carboxyl carrier protein [Candidatus Omnitrophota bacterium]